MYRVIFLGSPDFAIPTLEALVEDERFDVVAVFSQPDRKFGRKQLLKPSDVKKRALELDLNVYTPEKINTPENLEIIKNLKPDFLFTAAYGQIISNEILAIPKIEALNLHGSLLPKYRGASPIQSSLLHGDQETGITYIRMVEKMDAGEMFYKTKIKIEPNDNAATLFTKIAELGRKHTPEVLSQIAIHELKEERQAENLVSYCKKITKTDGKIDWHQETAEAIFNKIRAFTPWPGCYTHFNGKTLKLIEANCVSTPLEGSGGCFSIAHNRQQPGSVLQHNSQIQISTKSGFIIPKTVQLEGKKTMSIEAFIKGRPDFIGSALD